jgi:hypothetical protein
VAPVHGHHGLDGSILAAGINVDAGRFEPGRTPDRIHPIQVRMLLSFQRPPRPVGKGIPSLMAHLSGNRSRPDS